MATPAPRSPLTTILAPAPWAEPAVRLLRAAHDEHHALGVPAHVTLLGPFLPPEELTADVVARVGAVLSTQGPVAVVLDELATFGRATCLMPRDPAPLVALTAALRAAWPHVPAPASRPHLTVVRDADDDARARAEAELRPSLPLVGVLSRAMLLELLPGEPVRTLATFELGAGFRPA